MALCGDSVMRRLRGRNDDHEPDSRQGVGAHEGENGDKINQYAAYETSQMIHDKFVECYGSPPSAGDSRTDVRRRALYSADKAEKKRV